MITIQDLKEAIAECKGVRDPNANTCIKLAAFYIILDHMDAETKSTASDVSDKIPLYSYAPTSLDVISYDGNSEFARKIDGMNTLKALDIIDELMDTISVLNPGLYNGVMRKLSE